MKLRAWRKTHYPNAADVARRIGVGVSTYTAYERGTRNVPLSVWPKLRAMGFDDDDTVENLGTSAPVLAVNIKYAGLLSEGQSVDYVELADPAGHVQIPAHMTEGLSDPIGVRTTSDRLMPVVEPGDLMVFERSTVPKIDRIYLMRGDDGKAHMGALVHIEGQLMIQPLNPRFEAVAATGPLIGYLTGIRHDEPGEVRTRHVPEGIRAPQLYGTSKM